MESGNKITDLLTKIDDNIWEIPEDYSPGMNVPGRIYLSDKLIRDLELETLDQVANVAKLPGIQKFSMAMPDAHLGYGFPIGGVAAFDEEEGVISPGGVGFDINCGVRLLRSNLTVEEVRPKMKELTERMFEAVPSGVGSKSRLRVTDSELDDIYLHGSKWAVENGYGEKTDLEHCEGGGCIEGGDVGHISIKARKRGRPQAGTLGSGNHFLEVQYVDKIYDQEAADTFGLEEGQVSFMIHCGSRGTGHQICTDNIKTMSQASKKYGIQLPDKQLACAPAQSEEAQNYFGSMICAANYAWNNRQMITHWTRDVIADTFRSDIDELGLELVYDVAHNVAKLEEHEVDGKKKNVYVHRKGATRAFPRGHKEVPLKYRDVGQPVLIPGSMGTASYVLHGGDRSMDISFGSACHGAGRVMSRSHAKKEFQGEDIKMQLEKRGITVRSAHPAVIAEEAPGVYKSSSEVVNVVHELDIARKVAKMMPMGVIKG
ncbi:RtcB family protein [Methanococcoides alaskense]|uniref:tRNA-splicing ligase RtcB n=1 Tax=Methanococcoides alaskense TaxID=325778 RepID=A0AA90Z7E4_9EURY|nr:RtcB family protein [Methanococcoides alaskense]MDA0524136.1 RtcB family protein [Methanococcoides alaskense]MDR6222590.1 tRNA-splicing ligase RtcB [Methanococcoides alaskense]